jgi:hypothetical protein
LPTSSAQSGASRPVNRTDFMVMATGILMFILSSAPREGLSGPAPGDLSRGDNTPIGPGQNFNAIGMAAHDLARVEVSGIAGTRPGYTTTLASALQAFTAGLASPEPVTGSDSRHAGGGYGDVFAGGNSPRVGRPAPALKAPAGPTVWVPVPPSWWPGLQGRTGT